MNVDRDGQRTEVLLHHLLYYWPLKAPIADTELGKGYRLNAAVGVLGDKLGQASFDVFELGLGPPMPLGWEVQHPALAVLAGRLLPVQDRFLLVQRQLAHIQLLGLANSAVALKHLRVIMLALLGNSLAHHTNDVNRVNQGLRWREEEVCIRQIARNNLNEFNGAD